MNPQEPHDWLEGELLKYGSFISDYERAELERKASAYDELMRPMKPCGHETRYMVSADDGTSFCAVCVVASLTRKPRHAKIDGEKKKSRALSRLAQARLRRAERINSTTQTAK